MGQGELTAEDQSAPKLGRGVTKKSLIRWHSVQPEPDTGESGRRKDVDLGSGARGIGGVNCGRQRGLFDRVLGNWGKV